jgi:hypothetical protein
LVHINYNLDKHHLKNYNKSYLFAKTNGPISVRLVAPVKSGIKAVPEIIVFVHGETRIVISELSAVLVSVEFKNIIDVT